MIGPGRRRFECCRLGVAGAEIMGFRAWGLGCRAFSIVNPKL